MSQNDFSGFEEYETPAFFGTRSGPTPSEGSLGDGTSGDDE